MAGETLPAEAGEAGGGKPLGVWTGGGGPAGLQGADSCEKSIARGSDMDKGCWREPVGLLLLLLVPLLLLLLLGRWRRAGLHMPASTAPPAPAG